MAVIEQQPQQEGRNMHMMLAPLREGREPQDKSGRGHRPKRRAEPTATQPEP